VIGRPEHSESVTLVLSLLNVSTHSYTVRRDNALSTNWTHRHVRISTPLTRKNHGRLFFFCANWKWCSHVLSFTAAYSLRPRSCRAVYRRVISRGSVLTTAPKEVRNCG
jgi:hypothetical protein